MSPSAEPIRRTIAAPANAVESLVTELLEAYGELLSLAAEHRAAISRADGRALDECSRREADLADRLINLESRRRQLASSAPVPLRPPHSPYPAAAPPSPLPSPVTLSTIASSLPEPQRTRVLEKTGRLRDLVSRVRSEYAVIRAATQSVVAHIDGIVQQVGRRLSDTGTYGRAGRVDSSRPAVLGIDLTH